LGLGVAPGPGSFLEGGNWEAAETAVAGGRARSLAPPLFAGCSVDSYALGPWEWPQPQGSLTQLCLSPALLEASGIQGRKTIKPPSWGRVGWSGVGWVPTQQCWMDSTAGGDNQEDTCQSKDLVREWRTGSGTGNPVGSQTVWLHVPQDLTGRRWPSHPQLGLSLISQLGGRQVTQLLCALVSHL
jgi:hypothetical protein